MTDTRERSEVRAFIHGMWANVAGAWGASADDVDRTNRGHHAVDARRHPPSSW